MTNTAVSVLGRLPLASRWALCGLAVGILGLVVQAVADPAKFGAAQSSSGIPFPPGILFIAVAAVLTVATSRWRWHPVFAILTGVWIVGVGAPFLLPNLVSPNPGTVTGNVVMAVGLVAAAVAGVVAVARPRPPARREDEMTGSTGGA